MSNDFVFLMKLQKSVSITDTHLFLFVLCKYDLNYIHICTMTIKTEFQKVLKSFFMILKRNIQNTSTISIVDVFLLFSHMKRHNTILCSHTSRSSMYQ